MKHKFSLVEEINKIGEAPDYWNSFIEDNNFEVGVLKLKVNEKDIQKPHQSDEVYYIVEGNGKININGNDFEIEQGAIFHVPKNTPHRFHSNTKDIVAFYVLN